MEFATDEMSSTVNSLFQNADGLNFFRIDLKADSVEAVLRGEFKVLEINGMKSEPLHIYDANSSFVENARIIRNHWRIIESVTREQRELLSEVPSFAQGLKSWMSIRKSVR